MIIHVGTNNAMTHTPKEIFEKLISLKYQIEGILPKCEIIISKLIMRKDEPKAAKYKEELNCLIKSANILILWKIVISKENILVSVVYI